MNGQRVLFLGVVSALVLVLSVRVWTPTPALALSNPCALDSHNLVRNGSMAPGHVTPYGVVADQWEPFVMSPAAPIFEHVTNEQIDPNGSQYFWQDAQPFDAGIYQTVQDLAPGTSYRFWLGYALAAHDPGTAQNIRTNLIGREVGVDSTGGTDPRAASVHWNPVFFNGVAALNIQELAMVFTAQTDRATIFLRGINTDTTGRNKIWFDSVCMEAIPAPTPGPGTATWTPSGLSPILVPSATPVPCAVSNVATISVGARPKAIATDPQLHRVFVALFDSSQVAVIDATTNQRIAVWDTGGGGNSNGIAYANGRVYVAKRNTARVAVLDAANGNFLGDISVGRLPWGMAAGSNRIFAASFNDQIVSVVDPATNRVIASPKVGANPAQIAILNDQAFVSLFSGGLAILNSNGASVAKVSLPVGTFGVAVNSTWNRVYAGSRGDNSITAIDASTRAIIKTVKESEGVFALAAIPATNHLYTVLASSNRVRVRDAGTLAFISDVPIGVQGSDGGDGIGVIDNRVYVSNNAAGTVSVLADVCEWVPSPTPGNTATPTATKSPTPVNSPTSTSTPLATPTQTASPTATPMLPQCIPSVLKTISVDARPKGIAVDAAAQRAYVALYDTTSVAVIDTVANQKIAAWGTNSNRHANSVAVSNGRLFVSLRDAGNVVILNAANGAVLGQRATGSLPYGVGSASKVWVANFGAGTVSVLDPTTMNNIATTNTGANPSLVAPLNDRAYVSLYGSGVAIIGADGGLRGKIATGVGTFGVAANPILNRVYVGNRNNNTISLIDANTNAVVQTIKESASPFALAVNPAANHLFIVLPSLNRVRVRDAATLALIVELEIGAQGADGGDGIAIAGNRVYISNNQGRSVTVLNDACVLPATPTATVTLTPPATATSTQTNTATPSPSPSPTPTATGTLLSTPTLTRTPLPTPTAPPYPTLPPYPGNNIFGWLW